MLLLGEMGDSLHVSIGRSESVGSNASDIVNGLLGPANFGDDLLVRDYSRMCESMRARGIASVRDLLKKLQTKLTTYELSSKDATKYERKAKKT